MNRTVVCRREQYDDEWNGWKAGTTAFAGGALVRLLRALGRGGAFPGQPSTCVCVPVFKRLWHGPGTSTSPQVARGAARS